MFMQAKKERFGIGFTDDDIENQIADSVRQPGFELDAGLLECSGDFGFYSVDALPSGGFDTVFIRDSREDVESQRLFGGVAGLIDDFIGGFAQADGDTTNAGEGAEGSRRAEAWTAHFPCDELRFHERRREFTGKVRGDVSLEHGFRSGPAGGEAKGCVHERKKERRSHGSAFRGEMW